MQAFTRFPSIKTVQAPQAPSLQPFFVPVMCNRSRSKSSRDTRASWVSDMRLPLITRWVTTFFVKASFPLVMADPPSLDLASYRCVIDWFPVGSSMCGGRARPSTSLGDRVAQGRLQHLAGVVLRQFGEEHIGAGALEAGDAIEAVRVECSLEQDARRIVANRYAQHDTGDDLLAPLVVPPADHRRFSDGGMAKQRFLDLPRIDVRSAADDQILRAILEGEKASGVHCAQIAGVEPAARQRARRCVGIAPITLHHRRPAHEHLD